MLGFALICHLFLLLVPFNHISLTRLLSAHREQLRSGNRHVLEETLHQSLREQVVGDAEPRLQVVCVNC